jgi:hypothetical protein
MPLPCFGEHCCYVFLVLVAYSARRVVASRSSSSWRFLAAPSIASAGTPRAAAVQNLIVIPVIVGAATPALPATFSFNPVIERPYICFGAPESPLVAASVYDDLAAGSSVVANIGTLAALIQDPPVTYVDDTGVTKYVACTDLSSKWPQAQLSTTRVRIEFGVLNPYAPTVTCELFLMR